MEREFVEDAVAAFAGLSVGIGGEAVDAGSVGEFDAVGVGEAVAEDEDEIEGAYSAAVMRS